MRASLTETLEEWLSRPLVREVLLERNSSISRHEVVPSTRWPGYLAADPTALQVGHKYAGEGVTRAMLGVAGGRALEAAGSAREDLLVEVFVMCQMWGGGGSGRVMANTRTALADPRRTREVLSAFADAVVEDPAAAAIGELPGWSWAFSTKLGYALTFDSAEIEGGRPALIYDRFVANSLQALHASSYEGYRGYLEAVWGVASQLGVRPDAVEHLLFAPWVDLRTWGQVEPE